MFIHCERNDTKTDLWLLVLCSRNSQSGFCQNKLIASKLFVYFHRCVLCHAAHWSKNNTYHPLVNINNTGQCDKRNVNKLMRVPIQMVLCIRQSLESSGSINSEEFVLIFLLLFFLWTFVLHNISHCKMLNWIHNKCVWHHAIQYHRNKQKNNQIQNN